MNRTKFAINPLIIFWPILSKKSWVKHVIIYFIGKLLCHQKFKCMFIKDTNENINKKYEYEPTKKFQYTCNGKITSGSIWNIGL
jgi:hypothetical protein